MLSDTIVERNINTVSAEYLFTLDTSKTIIHYVRMKHILIPKVITNSSKYSIALMDGTESVRDDEWSTLEFVAQSDHHIIQAADTNEIFILFIDHDEKPLINRYSKHMPKEQKSWDIEELVE